MNSQPVPNPLYLMDDKDLVQSAKSGNRSALAVLLDRYRPIVLRHIQRYPLENATERNELVAEALLLAVRELPSYNGSEKFSTWLYRITARLMLAYTRSSRDASTVRTADRLRHALLGLPASLRQALDHWAQGMPVEEAAARANMPEAELRSWIHRARATLRGHLSNIVVQANDSGTEPA